MMRKLFAFADDGRDDLIVNCYDASSIIHDEDWRDYRSLPLVAVIDIDYSKPGSIESDDNPLLTIQPGEFKRIHHTRNDLLGCVENDLVVVRVGDVEYISVKRNKVQRFVGFPTPLKYELSKYGTGSLDLNDMARRYANGDFDQRAYAELNIAIEYSVAGFASLSDFHDMKLENPVWRYKQPDTTYLSASVNSGKMTREHALAQLMGRDKCTRQTAIDELSPYLNEDIGV